MLRCPTRPSSECGNVGRRPTIGCSTRTSGRSSQGSPPGNVVANSPNCKRATDCNARTQSRQRPAASQRDSRTSGSWDEPEPTALATVGCTCGDAAGVQGAWPQTVPGWLPSRRHEAPWRISVCRLPAADGGDMYSGRGRCFDQRQPGPPSGHNSGLRGYLIYPSPRH
jgi:hypothetical protein